MNYSIGIPKEIKSNENRVSLTPIEVKKITDLNIKVFIEKNAGLSAFFSNDDYLKVGAIICETAKEVYDKSIIIVKVKELLKEEFDFINDNFIKQSLNNIYSKEDIVCFNPKKGYECTSQIMNFIPDVKFVPLVNMSRDQVIDTLKKSKIYIDFGYHPGKDRFPREAALMDNIVIVGFRGSAMFYNDMPIDPTQYKFDMNNLLEVSYRIKECLTKYDEQIKDFNLYKNIILNQKEEFANQAKQIFL
jgi:hypothetical protein